MMPTEGNRWVWGTAWAEMDVNEDELKNNNKFPTMTGMESANDKNFGIWHRLLMKAVLEVLVAAFPAGNSFSLLVSRFFKGDFGGSFGFGVGLDGWMYCLER